MRVLVVINKRWERDPALAAMLSDETRPPNSPWPSDLRRSQQFSIDAQNTAGAQRRGGSCVDAIKLDQQFRLLGPKFPVRSQNESENQW